jgi:hypothetical protein
VSAPIYRTSIFSKLAWGVWQLFVIGCALSVAWEEQKAGRDPKWGLAFAMGVGAAMFTTYAGIFLFNMAAEIRISIANWRSKARGVEPRVAQPLDHSVSRLPGSDGGASINQALRGISRGESRR